jgi:hypothetical protein
MYQASHQLMEYRPTLTIHYTICYIDILLWSYYKIVQTPARQTLKAISSTNKLIVHALFLIELLCFPVLLKKCIDFVISVCLIKNQSSIWANKLTQSAFQFVFYKIKKFARNFALNSTTFSTFTFGLVQHFIIWDNSSLFIIKVLMCLVFIVLQFNIPEQDSLQTSAPGLCTQELHASEHYDKWYVNMWPD